jgi:hypothetical protein
MQPIIGGGQFLKKYELQRASLIFECVRRKQREDNVAMGQLRSGREKKKPKAEKNKKKKSAPAASPFTLLTGRDASGKKFS